MHWNSKRLRDVIRRKRLKNGRETVGFAPMTVPLHIARQEATILPHSPQLANSRLSIYSRSRAWNHKPSVKGERFADELNWIMSFLTVYVHWRSWAIKPFLPLPKSLGLSNTMWQSNWNIITKSVPKVFLNRCTNVGASSVFLQNELKYLEGKWFSKFLSLINKCI